MSDSMTTETIRIPGHNGDEIEAYLARPSDEGKRGGVVVIHHMPGYDRATKETARRFAELGYDAICPNLYWREAPGPNPTTRRPPPAPREASPMSVWSATWGVPPSTCARCPPPTARWA